MKFITVAATERVEGEVFVEDFKDETIRDLHPDVLVPRGLYQSVNNVSFVAVPNVSEENVQLKPGTRVAMIYRAEEWKVGTGSIGDAAKCHKSSTNDQIEHWSRGGWEISEPITACSMSPNPSAPLHADRPINKKIHLPRKREEQERKKKTERTFLAPAPILIPVTRLTV